MPPKKLNFQGKLNNWHSFKIFSLILSFTEKKKKKDNKVRTCSLRPQSDEIHNSLKRHSYFLNMLQLQFERGSYGRNLQETNGEIHVWIAVNQKKSEESDLLSSYSWRLFEPCLRYSFTSIAHPLPHAYVFTAYNKS